MGEGHGEAIDIHKMQCSCGNSVMELAKRDGGTRVGLLETWLLRIRPELIGEVSSSRSFRRLCMRC